MFTTKNWIVAGIVAADSNKVFPLMLEAHKQNGTLPPQSRYFSVDYAAKRIIVRGHYWYEGVFTAAPDPEGTLVTYQVNNIGPQSNIMPRISRWMVPLWQYKLPAQMRTAMQASLTEIGRTLGCTAFLR
jgi:hypothetical protein